MVGWGLRALTDEVAKLDQREKFDGTSKPVLEFKASLIAAELIGESDLRGL